MVPRLFSYVTPSRAPTPTVRTETPVEEATHIRPFSTTSTTVLRPFICSPLRCAQRCACGGRCGPRLVALSVAWCYRVSDWGLDALVDRCSRLRALDLTGLHQIVGERSLPRVAHAMPALEWLKLENCNRVCANRRDTLLESRLYHHLSST